jgi:peptidoglycan/LPS O-acetylase OafA/YrhL
MKIEKLESIRGFVAVYVVIHHFILVSAYSQSPAIVRLAFRFGREAVLTFFLLSGFVICLSFKNEKETFLTYFRKRFLRIYPILIVTFFISVVILYINGNQLNPSDLTSFINNFFQLQRVDSEPGIKIPPFLGNLPLWSLGYEWWFYMAFYPIYKLNKKFTEKFGINSIYLMFIFSMISWILFLNFPSHIFLVMNFYFLWWAGFYSAEIFKLHKTFNFRNMAPVLICLFLMAATMSIPILKQILIDHYKISEINKDFPITSYVYYYVEAFCLIVIGLFWWKIKLFKFDLIFGAFSRLANISYALYLVHFPIILLNLSFLNNIFLEILVKMIIIFTISYLLELHFQPWINKLYKKSVIVK